MQKTFFLLCSATRAKSRYMFDKKNNFDLAILSFLKIGVSVLGFKMLVFFTVNPVS